MAGRPKKSDSQKLAQGTLRPVRIITAVGMSPIDKLPTAPDYFTDYEKEFFERVASALFDSGILREVDVLLIEMHALWWHVYKVNREEVCKNAVQETDKGWKQVTGNLTAVKEAARNLQWFSEKYGLNLISKDKISAPVKKDFKSDKLKKMAE